MPEREAQQSHRGRSGSGGGASGMQFRAASQHQQQQRASFSTLSEPLHRLSASALSPEPTYCQVQTPGTLLQGVRSRQQCGRVPDWVLHGAAQNLRSSLWASSCRHMLASHVAQLIRLPDAKVEDMGMPWPVFWAYSSVWLEVVAALSYISRLSACQ